VTNRRCSVCEHRDRAAIEAALLLGPLSFTRQKQARLKPAAIQRHWQSHMDELRDRARDEVRLLLQTAPGELPRLTLRQARILLREKAILAAEQREERGLEPGFSTWWERIMGSQPPYRDGRGRLTGGNPGNSGGKPGRSGRPRTNVVREFRDALRAIRRDQ
jgi:hypothetical protein